MRAKIMRNGNPPLDETTVATPKGLLKSNSSVMPFRQLFLICRTINQSKGNFMFFQFCGKTKNQLNYHVLPFLLMPCSIH